MNTNIFIRNYINTKVTGDFMDHDVDPMDALKQATSNSQLRRMDDDIHYCCFKTNFNDKESVLMVFSMEMEGPITGSSKCSEKIMNLVYAVKKILKTTDYMHYSKVPIDGKKRKSIAILKIIKIIDEDDIL